MKMNTESHPPRLLRRFLAFYCREKYFEEIDGDLLEIYLARCEKKGRTVAKWYYAWDVIRFFKWSNLKKTQWSNSNQTTMLKNYLLIAMRNVRKERAYALFNFLGLYVGFISLILTVVYLNRQLGYDTQHPDVENTYRFLLVNGENGYRSAGSAGPWAPQMAEDFPEVLNYVRIGSFATSIFRHGEYQFYESGGALADPALLEMFRFDFKWGDAKTALDEPYNMVISEEMAIKYFGQENPVGEVFQVNDGEQFKITGVLKREQLPSHIEFDFVASFDSHQDDFRYDWVIQNYVTYLHLDAQANTEDFKEGLVDFFNRHTPETGVSIEGRRYDLQPVQDIYLYSDVNGRVPTIRRVMTFGFIGLFILIIALVNYVNLVTARSTQRLKEVGVRKAVGARKKQLVVQFLVESFYFCFVAFLVAVCTVQLFVPAYGELVNESLSFGIVEDLGLVVILLAITLLLGLASGFYPAVVLSALKPSNLMQHRASLGGGRNVFRRVLTGFQFFISLTLIIATLLVSKQLNYMTEKDLGFDQEAIMVVSLRNTSIMPNRFAFADRLEQSPYIQSVGLSGQAIGGGDWGMPFRYEGGEDPQPSRYMAVDATYAKSMDLKFVAGRNFADDLTTDVDKSYIVNETFVERVGWEDPVGKRIEMPARNPDGSNSWEPGTVIGVVKDFNYRNLRSNVLPLVISNRLRWTRMLFVKLDPNAIAQGVSVVEEEWKQVEGKVPFDYYFLDDRIDRFYQPEALLSKTAAIYSAVAIILACFGLFSLATFMAEQKMKEVSIRKVLGASVRQIFMMFSKPFAWIILISSLVAIPMALYFLNNWLDTFAYRVQVVDFLEIPLLAMLGMLLIALMTVAYQSLRLSHANPVRFLRND